MTGQMEIFGEIKLWDINISGVLAISSVQVLRRRANILIGTWSSNANLLLQSVRQNPR